MFPFVIENALPAKLFVDMYDTIVNPAQPNDWSLINYSTSRPGNFEHVSWGLHSSRYQPQYINAGIHIKAKIGQRVYKETGHKMDLELVRAYGNGNTSNQATLFHIDKPSPEYYTAVLFTEVRWDVTWGGEFVVENKETGKYHVFPYIPNNAIVIPACWEHKGNAPQNLTDKMRTTLACTYHAYNSPYNKL